MKHILLALALLLPVPVTAGLTDAPPRGDLPVVEWEEAKRILHEGDVVKVFQRHNLWVTFELRDGTVFLAKAPGIDMIFKEILACEKCGKIPFATE